MQDMVTLEMEMMTSGILVDDLTGSGCRRWLRRLRCVPGIGVAVFRLVLALGLDRGELALRLAGGQVPPRVG